MDKATSNPEEINDAKHTKSSSDFRDEEQALTSLSFEAGDLGLEYLDPALP
jgi:hypothetical protein